MLVQYEDQNQQPSLQSAWSWQDTQGSWLLIALAWAGLLVGVGAALYWAHLSVLEAIVGGQSDWPEFVWLALISAGAALIAPVLWPFLQDRRPQIATFVLVIGVLSWMVTSASGTLFLIEKAERPRPVIQLPTIPANQFEKDGRSIADAERDCYYGNMRGCAWLNGEGGAQARARRRQYTAEHARPRRGPPIVAASMGAVDIIAKLRTRLALFAMVLFGGSVAIALIWGAAEALKAMYSEPGALMPRAAFGGDGLPVPALGASPLDLAFNAWAAQSLEPARGERASLATMHAHYRAWCLRRGLPTFASDEAFGRALNRPPDPADPNDLGGPMIRYGAYPIKSGGSREYIGVRIKPDDILDEIEGAA